MQFDAEIDASGLLCPLPVLKARKRLLSMQPGAVLKVLATDPVAVVDMPHFCAEAGHDLLANEPLGPATAYFIRRGPDRAET
ncbi:MAG TPA: sulfurtransferase TusA family protein [Albidovulum sp.]|uniref:sulfurtransferase TusA family protein n=1 Tax=Albidovulum sp. TaxID=1872424 RepID=UPI002D048D52|nr:sulfurtransferase TusA family protein [Albidovulum sp.]